MSLLRGKHTYLLTIKGKQSDAYKKTLSRIFETLGDVYGFQSFYRNFHYHILFTTDALLSDLIGKIPRFRDAEFRVALLSPTLAQSANSDIQIKAFNSNSTGFINYVFGARNFQPFICAAAKRQPIFASKRLKPELERTTRLLKTLGEMYAARKLRQDNQKTAPSLRLNLNFFNIMETYFTDLQLPPFLYASERSRRAARGKVISASVAHIAVFEDPTSPYFNLEDRYLTRKFAMAARDVSYAETFDYFAYPQRSYDQINRLKCTSRELRVLDLRRQHDLCVLEYVQGHRTSILPPRPIFNTITPMEFAVKTPITYATAGRPRTPPP